VDESKSQSGRYQEKKSPTPIETRIQSFDRQARSHYTDCSISAARYNILTEIKCEFKDSLSVPTRCRSPIYISLHNHSRFNLESEKGAACCPPRGMYLRELNVMVRIGKGMLLPP
jgi:hypothetical protein